MIRPARPDDAKIAAPLIIQALAPGSFSINDPDDETEAYPVMEDFFRHKASRYSYLNTLVYETAEEGITGIITCYDGADDFRLSRPVAAFFQSHYPDEEMEYHAESDGDEFYIDALSVRKDQQGKGIGSILIDAACKWGRELGHRRIGLLVDDENPAARRLYERLGFTVRGHKHLWGHEYDHMQKEL
ncbi:GNAT family N-acetyltransferase [Chitinophagaceae bacterium MMS25-I14]